jgi:hypothetical protein
VGKTHLALASAHDVSGASNLKTRHTHIILDAVASWAAGAEWTAAGALADNTPLASVVIGDGDVRGIDVDAGVNAGRPVIAIRGTGGVADALVIVRRVRDTDARAEAIAALGLGTVAEIAGGPVTVAAIVARLRRHRGRFRLPVRADQLGH